MTINAAIDDEVCVSFMRERKREKEREKEKEKEREKEIEKERERIGKRAKCCISYRIISFSSNVPTISSSSSSLRLGWPISLQSFCSTR